MPATGVPLFFTTMDELLIVPPSTGALINATTCVFTGVPVYPFAGLIAETVVVVVTGPLPV